eukprot:TRINITY_DN40692_c0_g1_i1.p1 TRINITY_DN40692_c0_g1~~TRINITY_DN40692_c0_g1_i1.p1  ORF type:complete len:406 (+),score=62.80 TRINITY_DN40692_c0_g1_i1:74-1219(+)
MAADGAAAGELDDLDLEASSSPLRLRYPTALDLPEDAGAASAVSNQPRAASVPGRRRAAAVGGGRRPLEEAGSPAKEEGAEAAGVKIDRRVFRKLRKRRPGSEPAPSRRGTKLGSRRPTRRGQEVECQYPSNDAYEPLDSGGDFLGSLTSSEGGQGRLRGSSPFQSGGRRGGGRSRGGGRLQDDVGLYDVDLPGSDYEDIRRLASEHPLRWGGQFADELTDYQLRELESFQDFSHSPGFSAMPRSYGGSDGYAYHDEPWGGDAWLYSTPERAVGAAYGGSGASRGYLFTPPKRAAVKSDPVSRGAQFRATWGQDRFLQNTGTRKFDLRGCGSSSGGVRSSPAGRRHASGSMMIPDYVPPHQKRRDALRLQVRQHLLVPDDF